MDEKFACFVAQFPKCFISIKTRSSQVWPKKSLVKKIKYMFLFFPFTLFSLPGHEGSAYHFIDYLFPSFPSGYQLHILRFAAKSPWKEKEISASCKMVLPNQSVNQENGRTCALLNNILNIHKTFPYASQEERNSKG